MTSFIIDLHNKCAYIYYKTEVAHYDRNSGSHISGMVAQAYRTGGSFEHRLFNYSVIDRFIKKIIVREDSEFVWILNFNTLMNMKPIERINHLSEEYKKTLVVDTNFNIFLEFEISVDECADYMQTRGRRIRKGQWQPLKVKVALDLNN